MIYRYPPLLQGTLVRRYKRFFAEVALESGEVVTAHCPNTGPMTGVSQVGSPVCISRATAKGRTLLYTWELIEVDGTWVGINTSLPNRIIHLALKEHQLPGLPPYTEIQPEVRYGEEHSRIDFLLRGPAPTYVEVKNTTWALPYGAGKIALFPDTVTTRGHKHLRELILLVEQGVAAAIVFFVNRGDCPVFAPGEKADPEYGRLLRLAHSRGVLVLPYRFRVSPEGIALEGLIPVVW
ncbi:DNA/RNA nuclease SfsA [Anthocerotibacter panamensis]|uniref:DNA/RNA nuclease SfsA n=1 Tax=Anthocerotibacter panamensis TaxID=2857077 RepID=UPI001C401A06|nr:DNA/RNA nuclease SfsA [Anthocerotibacter panamensis]